MGHFTGHILTIEITEIFLMNSTWKIDQLTDKSFNPIKL